MIAVMGDFLSLAWLSHSTRSQSLFFSPDTTRSLAPRYPSSFGQRATIHKFKSPFYPIASVPRRSRQSRGSIDSGDSVGGSGRFATTSGCLSYSISQRCGGNSTSSSPYPISTSRSSPSTTRMAWHGIYDADARRSMIPSL
ncbi:hypothetical protein B0H13DRAFT_1980445 [Mycena leptocephala]|nr:hypothetical protein B0H13DRAFT_1980445 [Mycena leptocephala]